MILPSAYNDICEIFFLLQTHRKPPSQQGSRCWTPPPPETHTHILAGIQMLVPFSESDLSY